ncbi:hypothetical protein Leryth_012758 [Lithospermum erythrorhizon]|nr:hypothetical protein Leryth_012758 [Lithospermum erythrorhizon]
MRQGLVLSTIGLSSLAKISKVKTIFFRYVNIIGSSIVTPTWNLGVINHHIRLMEPLKLLVFSINLCNNSRQKEN